jgi:hypothetical protein
MGYVSQEFRTRFQTEANIVSFSTFHTGPGSVHPLVQCVPGAFYSVSKRPGREYNTRSYTPLPLRVHGVTLVKQTMLFLYFHSVDNPWYTIRTESNRRRKADKDRELPSGYLKLFYPLHIRGPLIGQTKYERRANSWAYVTVSIYPPTSKTLFCNVTLSWKERVACGCTDIQCCLNLLFSKPPAFYRLTVVWRKFRTDDRLHLAQV